MIAITAFALEEAITKQGVVTNTPFFFQLKTNLLTTVTNSVKKKKLTTS